MPAPESIRVLVEIRENESDTNAYLGVGRGKNDITALSKAFGEAIERLYTQKIFNVSKGAFESSMIKLEQGKISFPNSDLEKTTTPESLQSSNGWAIHFTPELALRNALLEALERHILIFSFYCGGWNAFTRTPSTTIDNILFDSLYSNYSFGGLTAGICRIKSQRFPGFTMGYACDTNEEFLDSDEWEGAFFEAYEPALAYKDTLPNIDQPDIFGINALLDVEKSYLEKTPELDFLKSNLSFEKEQSQLNDQGPIQFNFDVFDIQSMLNTSFPLYISRIYGGGLIPLFLNSQIDNKAKNYLTKVFDRYQLDLDKFSIHPII